MLMFPKSDPYPVEREVNMSVDLADSSEGVARYAV